MLLHSQLWWKFDLKNPSTQILESKASLVIFMPPLLQEGCQPTRNSRQFHHVLIGHRKN